MVSQILQLVIVQRVTLLVTVALHRPETRIYTWIALCKQLLGNGLQPEAGNDGVLIVTCWLGRLCKNNIDYCTCKLFQVGHIFIIIPIHDKNWCIWCFDIWPLLWPSKNLRSQEISDTSTILSYHKMLVFKLAVLAQVWAGAKDIDLFIVLIHVWRAKEKARLLI